MVRPDASQAIEDALATGTAVLKFISRNDVGDTESHQCGYYLPRSHWRVFSAMPPMIGSNSESAVRVIWGNGLETDSKVKWYGKGTRREYRLTCFGRGFPYLDRENVGSLLVIVPRSYDLFHAYVLDFDEDIEAVQTTLGVTLAEKISIFEKGKIPPAETQDECVERHFLEFTHRVTADFPKPSDMSAAVLGALQDCIEDLGKQSLDERLLQAVGAEFRLFQLVERKICGPLVTGLFADMEAFLKTAQTILQRRKSRAGLAFQNHTKQLLIEAGVEHEAQPRIDGNPDFIFPSAAAYKDSRFPAEKLFSLALKTTCKDRWRQVLKEAKRLPQKYLLTLQPGISVGQLREMRDENVVLVVPEILQKDYNVKDSRVELLTVESFAKRVRGA